MAASFFTEDDLLGAASGAADSDERGREKEEGREGGCALSWYRGWLCVRTARKRLSSPIESVFRPQLPAAPLMAPSR